MTPVRIFAIHAMHLESNSTSGFGESPASLVRFDRTILDYCPLEMLGAAKAERSNKTPVETAHDRTILGQTL